jgi:small-conductance mechanosensitive channel
MPDLYWNGIDLVRIAVTLAAIVAGFLLIGIVSRFVRRLLSGIESRLGFSYGAVSFTARAVTALLWLCFLLLILELWGLSVSGIWTVLVSGVTLVGVGFLAVWTMISNVTANFFIVVWRPFRMGHEVELIPENVKGRVVERSLMFTTLREKDGTVLQIPNNLFFQKVFRVGGEAGDPYVPAPSELEIQLPLPEFDK